MLLLRELLLAIVYDLTQLARSLESRYEMLIERDGFTGTRIARHSGHALLRLECTEAADLDVIAVRERIGNGFEKSVNKDLGL